MGAQQLLLRPRSLAVNVTPRTVFKSGFALAPATATATAVYALQNDGVLRLNGTTDIAGEWRVAGVAADYEVRFTHLADSIPSGAAYGSWLNLGTTRTLSLTATRSTNGSTTESGDVLVEIGRAGAGLALVSAEISFIATAEREA